MKSKITIEEMLALETCIGSILGTSEELLGGIIFRLHANARIMREHLDDYDKSRKTIVLNLVEKDKEDKPVYIKQNAKEKKDNEPQRYKFPEGNEDKANKEIQSLLKKEFEVKFSLIKLSVFEALKFDTSKIPGFYVFTDHLVAEDELTSK